LIFCSVEQQHLRPWPSVLGFVRASSNGGGK